MTKFVGDYEKYKDMIFVFGSNRRGLHGKGAALEAYQKFGAIRGIGEGPMGSSYAIPTVIDPFLRQRRQLPLETIQASVSRFLKYAEKHPDKNFWVVRVGCNLAGYLESEIAPMFAGASTNVYFENEEWREWK